MIKYVVILFMLGSNLYAKIDVETSQGIETLKPEEEFKKLSEAKNPTDSETIKKNKKKLGSKNTKAGKNTKPLRNRESPSNVSRNVLAAVTVSIAAATGLVLYFNRDKTSSSSTAAPKKPDPKKTGPHIIGSTEHGSSTSSGTHASSVQNTAPHSAIPPHIPPPAAQPQITLLAPDLITTSSDHAPTALTSTTHLPKESAPGDSSGSQASSQTQNPSQDAPAHQQKIAAEDTNSTASPPPQTIQSQIVVVPAHPSLPSVLEELPQAPKLSDAANAIAAERGWGVGAAFSKLFSVWRTKPLPTMEPQDLYKNDVLLLEKYEMPGSIKLEALYREGRALKSGKIDPNNVELYYEKGVHLVAAYLNSVKDGHPNQQYFDAAQNFLMPIAKMHLEAERVLSQMYSMASTMTDKKESLSTFDFKEYSSHLKNAAKAGSPLAKLELLECLWNGHYSALHDQSLAQDKTRAAQLYGELQKLDYLTGDGNNTEYSKVFKERFDRFNEAYGQAVRDYTEQEQKAKQEEEERNSSMYSGGGG